MNSPTKNSCTITVVYTACAIFFGIAILFVSLTRASLQVCAKNNKENNLRVNQVELSKKQNGEQAQIYKLPEVTTLRTSPLYVFKEGRDFLWLKLAGDNYNKSKLALLMADKKIAEAQILFQNNENELALSACKDAVDNIDFANKHLNMCDGKRDDVYHLSDQISNSTNAYIEILKNNKNTYNIEDKKCVEIINNLKDINEIREN